jgi:hypothetical protein
VRRFFTLAAAGLLAGCWVGSAGASELNGSAPAGSKAKSAPKVCTTEGCGGDYGTSVHFVKTPSEAAKQALKEEKLVCVLHVSGLFENPDFT